MRQKALPLAYRRTIFHLNDMDELIKLLLAVGRIGRDNIESLGLAWESRADSEFKFESVRLYFERDLISRISPNVFKPDPGIRELCSIRAFKGHKLGLGAGTNRAPWTSQVA